MSIKINYEKLNRKALGCMYVAGGNMDIILASCILDLLIVPYIRYRRYRYCITDDCIDINEGFLFIERNIVPIERLHKIKTMRGPIDRMFGLTKVIVTTAGGDVTIRFLEQEREYKK